VLWPEELIVQKEIHPVFKYLLNLWPYGEIPGREGFGVFGVYLSGIKKYAAFGKVHMLQFQGNCRPDT